MSGVSFRTAPVKQERSREREETILNVLENLLMNGTSFDDITVEQIAREGGFPTSNFYVRFPSKNAALMQLYADRILPRFLDERLGCVSAAACQGKSTREVVGAYLLNYLSVSRKYAPVLKYVVREGRYGKVPVAARSASDKNAGSTYDALLARLIERNRDLKHPDFAVAVQLLDISLTIVLRDMALFAPVDNVAGNVGLDDEHFVQMLADSFVTFLEHGGADGGEMPTNGRN